MLWLALQLAPSAPPAAAAEPVPADAAGRLPDRADRPAGPTTLATRPERSLLRPGNVIAFLLLAGGGAWAIHLRRRQDGPGEAAREPALRALDTLTLAPGQSVRLVALGDEVLLLGVAQGGVSLLCRYHADEAPAALSEPASGPTDFGDLLRRAGLTTHA